MTWTSNTTGNGITVWQEEHFSEYPDGFIVGNQTTSIGYFQILNAGGPDVVVPNITTQAKSIVISVIPVDDGAGLEYSIAGQFFRQSTFDNAVGVSFTIKTSAAIGVFSNTGIFRYWLIHPAWK